LKDLTLKGILQALETQANDQEDFEPYLTWMHSLLQMTVCTLEPSYLDSLYEERDAAVNVQKKNKKKKGAKKVVE